ncbi:hypothetical protein RJ55_06687 [Drechmeria coniospora]|nr:hypothetical protein RJ55_06687 [Drechmeria coniospora]
MRPIANIDIDGLAARACELCRREDGLKRCSACQAVYYCGRDCQAADREEHRMACKEIKRARRHYESEYERLRDMPGDFLTPERMFETQVGRFWGFLETRPYMRARFGLVNALLLHYGTVGGPVDVVQASLDHLLDMMRLCRSDNMGLRQLVPSQYVRLGRDQDAYDFVKWHAVTSTSPGFDYDDMSLPYLDVRDADVFESPHEAWLREGWMELSQVVAVTLIKVRLLLDLQAMRCADATLAGVFPAEIVDLIHRRLLNSALAGRADVLSAGAAERARLLDKVRSQIGALYGAVDRYNKHFWPTLVDTPDSSMLELPSESYSPSTPEEAQLMVSYSYAAWYETPGAISVLEWLDRLNYR